MEQPYKEAFEEAIKEIIESKPEVQTKSVLLDELREFFDDLLADLEMGELVIIGTNGNLNFGIKE